MESLVYAKNLADLELFDLETAKEGDLFYRCYDMQGFRFIYQKKVLRTTPKYIYLATRLIRTMNICNEENFGDRNFRVKKSYIQSECFKNYR